MIKIKYNNEIKETTMDEFLDQTIRNIFKLLPLYEENKEWQKYLQSFIEELVGANEIFLESPTFIRLISKLEGLNQLENDRQLYRKVVFDSITLTKALYPPRQVGE
jgi:hypothetical protein